MAELSEIVTPSMIAKETGISYHTILARIHTSNIPTLQLGKFIAIKREHVAAITHPLYKRGTDK